MSTTTTSISAARDIDLLETRLAAGVAAALRVPSETLPPGVAERLRFAREHALARAAAAPAPAATGLGGGGGAALLGRLWPRLGMLMPVLVAAVGLMLVVDARQREDIEVAAEIDSALLADDLPPAAYADPGFVAFLKLRQP